MDTLTEFVALERERFAGEYGGRFSSAFQACIRYRGFLKIIEERYRSASAAFMEATEEFQRSLRERSSGERSLTAHEFALLQRQGAESEHVHLEVESFYLFAKIMLDHVARAFDFCFRPRGFSFDSHDQLTKNLQSYCEAAGLTPPSDALAAAVCRLKSEIADYRDYEIAHNKKPREMKGTMFGAGGTSVRIFASTVYPKATDRQVESATPTDLLQQVDDYVRLFLEFYAANRNRVVGPTVEAEKRSE